MLYWFIIREKKRNQTYHLLQAETPEDALSFLMIDEYPDELFTATWGDIQNLLEIFRPTRTTVNSRAMGPLQFRNGDKQIIVYGRK